MQRVAVGTVVAKNYLGFARVLARSFAALHPDVPLFVALADEVDGYFEPRQEPYHLVRFEELPVPDRRRFLFRYTRQQVAIGAKPYLITHLLDRGFDTVLFIDADILILNDLTPLFTLVARHPIVLTPHLLSPLAGTDRAALELNILLSGVYNGGFVGVSNTPPAHAFLAWWRQRLYDHCRHAVAEGMHFDQCWLNLAPMFFDGVHLLRDPGVNVAYWNLAERDVQVSDDGVRVRGVPCRFFHFSGFDPQKPEQVTRYRPHLTMADAGAAAPLYARYAGMLLAEGHAKAKDWPYAHDWFDNGVPIPDVARALHQELGEPAHRFGNPFETQRTPSFFQWLNERRKEGTVPTQH